VSRTTQFFALNLAAMWREPRNTGSAAQPARRGAQLGSPAYLAHTWSNPDAFECVAEALHNTWQADEKLL
jgi:hypothetical protein